MMTAEDELQFVRPKLLEAIEALRGRGNTRMRAYSTLGSEVGKSATWVRKVLGRQHDVEVRLRDAWNIAAAYDRICNRIEAAADLQETLNAIPGDAAHALRKSRPAMGEGENSCQMALAEVVGEVGQ